ncbi:hypothetical protein WDU94_012796 [Cyamophila willieti]
MTTNRMLQVHFRSVHQVKNPDRSTFDCCFCSELFHLKKDYHQHLTQVHGQKVSTRYRFQLCACSQCGKMFYNAASLRTHVNRVHSTELKFQCHLCDKSFRAKKYLLEHIKRHDLTRPRPAKTRSQPTSSADKPFKCNHCDNSYETVHQLGGHRMNCAFYLIKPDQVEPTITSGDESFTIVSKEFKQGNDRKGKSSPPSFQCPHCDKVYSKYGSLYMHMRNHDKTRVPTVCTVCGKSVINMKLHMNQVHEQPDRRPHMCDICGASFKKSSGLSTHRPIHTGKRHLCPICGRGFTQRGDMRKHVKALHEEVVVSLQNENETTKQNTRIPVISRLISDFETNEEYMTRMGFAKRFGQRKKPESFSDDLPEYAEFEQFDRMYAKKEEIRAKTVKSKPVEAVATVTVTPVVTVTVTPMDTVTVTPVATAKVTPVATVKAKPVKKVKPFPCNMCFNSFDVRSELYIHQVTQHKESNFTRRNVFNCCFCSSIFMSKSEYHTHLTEVHDQRITKHRRFLMCACATCGKLFTNKQNLKKHVTNTHNTPADSRTCDICQNQFKSNLYLRKHIKQVHIPKKRETNPSKQTNATETVQSKNDNLKPNPKIICSLCNKEFESPTQLFGHKKTCSIFLQKEENKAKNNPSTKSETKCYFLTTKSKPVKTESIEPKKKGRSSSSELGPYTCAICNKTFPLKGRIYTHMINCHLRLPRNRQRQMCPLCGAHVLDIKAHMSVHSSDRPFYCELCGSSFKKSDHLKTHQLIHKGSKPHVCPVCEKAYTQIGDMYKHAKYFHNYEVPRKKYNPKRIKKTITQEIDQKIIEETEEIEEIDPIEIVSTTFDDSEIEHITIETVHEGL